jgi:LPS-assembly protein
MGLGVFSKRFASVAACLLSLPLAMPCLADPPPIGYTGPVPTTSSIAASVVAPTTPSPTGPLLPFGTPPLGYVGPMPHARQIASDTTVTVPLSQPPTPTPTVISTPLVPKPLIPIPRGAVAIPTGTSVNIVDNSPPPPTLEKTVIPPIGYVGPVPPRLGYTGPALPGPLTPPVIYADETNAAHTGETLISAQQMHSDSGTGITIATGKVEIVRGDYVLHADKVVYDQKTGVMTADGNVALLTPNGQVEFADHEQVTGDMKQAFTSHVGILFPDNSRMAGLTGQRYDERYTVVDKAMYTACNICRQNPDNPPLWQLRANTITHDNVAHEVYYHDATIDFAGVPVAYTPYVSAPDPSVERREGFLSPSPGVSPNIGGYLKVPYYVDIAPDKDMTITPTISTTDKLQFDTQYRERFEQGKLNVEGSITRADLLNDNGIDEGEQWRGHLFGNFLYNIDNTWRAGTDVQYASDKSYLHRYDISSLDQTTTRAYVEGFQGRDYAALNSYYFQDLRPGTDVSEPVIPPSATFSAKGDPGQTLVQQGPDTRRVSTNVGWQRQLISDTGLETTVSGLFRTDSYWADNVVADDNSGDIYKRALFTRQFEQANAVMRYPMGRSGEGYQQLVEPIIAVTAAPDVRVISEQPIEESLDTEFDETNLFSPNRFTGSDLIEGGSRVTYGLRNAVTADSGARVDIFGGESYDFTTNSQFPDESGLNGHASDYVGRIDFAPVDWFNVNYGFRLAQNDFSPQRQDALVSVGKPVFHHYIRYIEAYETDTDTGLIDKVRQATLGFSSAVTKFWTLSGAHTQAFDPQPGPRDSSLTLSYVDECFAFGVTASHDDTNRLDISSGTSVSFHIYLKNLGGTNTDSTSSVSFPANFRQTVSQ